MRRILTAVLAVLIGLSMLSAPASAQERKQPTPQSKKESAPEPALAVVNNPTPSYLSGEVNVTVRGDENPIIRLQMVPNGQTLVEFPAKDRIFKVNPADPDLVTIEDSPTKETDCYILLRSSKQFLPGLPGSQSPPAGTSMIVQMNSGMVITLLIHPAREFGHVVHRCVVRYDRDAIVKARQAAGLAVNLDKREETAAAKAPASVQIAPLPKTTPENISPSTPVSQSTQNAESPLSETPASTKETDRVVEANTKAAPSTMELGAAGMHNQVRQWTEQGFMLKLLDKLLECNFGFVISSDHGNEAEGCGRPSEGAVADLRGERARVYPDEILRAVVKRQHPDAIEWPAVGLPGNYLPLLAAGRSAFIPQGKRIVGHGGISIEELIVPLIRVERKTL
jgi:hypothetical protein